MSLRLFLRAIDKGVQLTVHFSVEGIFNKQVIFDVLRRFLT